MNSTLVNAVRAGVGIAFLSASASAARAADAPTPVLTYLQRFDESVGDRTYAGSEYLQVDAIGDVRNVVAAPAAAVSDASLGAAANAPANMSAACYRLSQGLLPTALVLAPGASAAGGSLDVSLGDARARLPISFSAVALTPRIERVSVSAGPSAPFAFSGSFDIAQNVVLESTFTLTAPASAGAPQQATTCRMNLMVPSSAPVHTTSV